MIECHNWAPNILLLSIHNSLFKEFCRNNTDIFIIIECTHQNKGHYTTQHCRILSIGFFFFLTDQRWLTTIRDSLTLRAPVTHRIRRHKLAGVDVAVETGWEGIIMISNQLHIHKRSQFYTLVQYFHLINKQILLPWQQYYWSKFEKKKKFKYYRKVTRLCPYYNL